MFRPTTPCHALPYVKLGALVLKQLTKPLVTRIVHQSGKHPVVFRFCVTVGRFYLGTTGSLETLARSFTEKEEFIRQEAERIEEKRKAKEEWRKSMIQEAILAAREVVATENKMRHRTMEVRDAEMVAEAAACAAAFAVADVTLDARKNATDAAVGVLLETSNDVQKSEGKQSIRSKTVISSQQQQCETKSVSNTTRASFGIPLNNSISSTKPNIKSESISHKAGSVLSKYSVFTHRNTLGRRTSPSFNFYKIPRKAVKERYYPSNVKSNYQLEVKIRDEGAEVICNLLVFFLLAVIVIYEYWMSSESTRLKEALINERLRRLEQKVNILIEIENSERLKEAIKEHDIMNAQIDKDAAEGAMYTSEGSLVKRVAIANIQMLAAIPNATVVEVQSIFGRAMSNGLYLLTMMGNTAVNLVTALYSCGYETEGGEIREAEVSTVNGGTTNNTTSLSNPNVESAPESSSENSVSRLINVFKGIWSKQFSETK
eukprot:Tbor_TRINITY_DN6175_c1_g2::TRINITY_DN6175_c1_g2_i2::g.21658::m.21658